MLDVKRTKFEDGIDRFIKKAGGCERYFVLSCGDRVFSFCVYKHILYFISMYIITYLKLYIYIRIYYDYD